MRKMDLWPYAVKVLPKCIGARERESALQEIYALAAQGDNLHVVRYYNAWEEEDVIYIQVPCTFPFMSSVKCLCNPTQEASQPDQTPKPRILKHCPPFLQDGVVPRQLAT